MAKRKFAPRLNELRKKAENLLAEKGGKVSRISLNQDIQELNHELSIYHIELEMQNDELRRAQEELEESSERYVDLYENAPVGYLTLDEKGVVSDMNLTAARLLGIERTFLLNKPFTALIAPECQDVFYLHRRDVLRSPGNHACELMLRRSKGEGHFLTRLESRAVQSNGSKTIRTALIEITERKQAEEEIRKSFEIVRRNEEQLRVLIDNVGSGVALIDEAGKFSVVNRAFLRMFGLDSESDILNINSQDWSRWEVYGEDGKLLHVDDHPVRKAAMTGKPVTSRLVAVRNPGANELTRMLINAQPLLREDGTAMYKSQELSQPAFSFPSFSFL
jgi:PAS domain S-box-containing protein